VELSGSGAGSPSSFGTATTAITGDLAPVLLVGGGLLLGVLLGLYIWLRRRNVPPEPPRVTADALARQIAELDAAFAAGEIPKKTYDKQRAALKARLTRLLIGGEDE
jgi:Tfp pilus assembly protein PilN